MVTLGFLCLFMAFILAIMFVMALAAHDRAENENKGELIDERRSDGEK